MNYNKNFVPQKGDTMRTLETKARALKPEYK